VRRKYGVVLCDFPEVYSLLTYCVLSAEDAGIIILNEVGLDPGLDHMR
jgi:saccharopine dehydrogenase-like NADP-dependent oxidoreductase